MRTNARLRLLIVTAIGALVAATLAPTAAAAEGEGLLTPIEAIRLFDEPSPDIVGGSEATPGEYPFAVSLHMEASGYSWPHTWSARKTCGATLIDPEWALTAAHCFDDWVIERYPYSEIRQELAPEDITARIGRHDLNTTTGEELGATEFHVHPLRDGYGPYDIALVKLDGASSYEPVSLATSAAAYPFGTSATAIGWGDTEYQGSGSDVLLEVQLPVRTDGLCDVLHSSFLPEVEMCAGEFGVDTCQGDSGGPLLVNDGTRWAQIGITSRGRGCATLAGVYTEVAAFSDWIRATSGVVVGSPPIAGADSYRVRAGLPFNAPAPGVLENDSDPDLDTLTASLTIPPATGSVEFAADGSFTYVSSTPGFDSFAYEVSDGWHTAEGTVTVETLDYSAFKMVLGDFTGNGVADMAAFDPGTGVWTVGVVGPDVSHTVWDEFSPSIELTTTLVGDYNGDGKDDLANFDRATGQWWISVSTGSGFATSVWMTFSQGIALSNQFVGDFNGDGVDDLANFEVTTGKWFVSLSNGVDGFATSQWSKFTASLELPSQFVGDFNGDGLDDLANYHLASGRWFISTSTGTSFATGAWMKFTAGTEFFSQFVGDFNGDGIDDLANYQIETGKWFISISNGNGGFATGIWSTFTPSIVISSQFIGDFNGDGMSDLANFEVTTGKWFISISTGAGRFLTSMWSAFTPSLELVQHIGDFGGDGLDDLLNCQMPVGKLWISQSTGTGFATASHGYLPY